MPRPKYEAAKARRVLREWVATRIPLAPVDAPITVDAALEHLATRGLAAHRATLYAHDLHKVVIEGQQKQRQEGGGSTLDVERRAYEEQLADLRRANVELDAKNRMLLGQVAVMLFNAKANGITHDQLVRPMPVPDRTESRAGRRRQ
jgi:hypothetical protein